ncbi:MAG TPA: amidase [Steroidobacteraceae bacterium]|nr:amidase [Steroidobacteraceae bacterium]
MSAPLVELDRLALDATATAEALAYGHFSARELVATLLARVDAQNPQLHAYTHVYPEMALASATQSDARRARGGSLGPLDGMPIAIKGNIAVSGWPQHAGLRFRHDSLAREDAFVVDKLRAAGAIVVGLTNMDEGALGAAGRNPFYGDVVNPIAAGLSTGGSSAGAAAALAAHLATVALGTDTIGSVRIPAAWCGVTALKPTFGAISTRGVIPTHHRFDHVGPMARSARDLELLLGTLVGWDRACRVSFPLTLRAAPSALRSMRIGFVSGFDALAPDDASIAGYNLAIQALTGAGHTLQHIDVTGWQLARAYRALFALCEIEMARAHAARFASSPQDFSSQLQRLLDFGGRQTGADIAQYESRLAALVARVLGLFETIDVLLTPTTPTSALTPDSPRLAECATFTGIASATGRPAVALPVKLVDRAAPTSVQLIGQPGDDYVVLRLAQSLEAAMS